MSYDANGNITYLNRKGRSVNTAIALDLDQLTYSYDGNILQKVVDSSNNTDGFKQGSTADKHYDYDSFGNLKVDRNKGITVIKYNHLNLPVEILFDRGEITYLYTATGEKINQGLNMSFIYNSIKGDAGRPVFEIEGKASIGLQAGLSVPFGSVEAGAITADIGSLGYSNQNPDQPIAKWGDGTGHNFIGGSLNAPYFKNIAISGKLDYVTKDMTPSGQ